MMDDKKPYIAFHRGTSPTKFEIEVKYTHEDVKKYFEIKDSHYFYGLLYCDSITDGENQCKIQKVFDYKNKKIVLIIGD